VSFDGAYDAEVHGTEAFWEAARAALAAELGEPLENIEILRVYDDADDATSS